ncbi:helicase-exonuclease AddAB subunit AddB [Bacillus testis]|uniref:helicase-exonuclease AddAB subunit AddB n=1 Tax=Bacillus testis TaxID=1622072 RepID=UPI00067E9F01|nr:helicase-exonuclease AddAB subunit AddB [Bacillus testis]
MSLRFVLGRSGSGKTTYMINDIRQKLYDQPGRKPLLYLVPDQMTFLSEYNLAGTPGLKGTIAAQVFSFPRLALRVLQETGGMSRLHLSSAGINMMITKIIEEKKDELRLFQRSASKAGFTASMEQMLIELKRYCISPEDMGNLLKERMEQETEQSLKDKWHDLQIIYSEFEQALIGKYIDSEDYLTLLAEKIPHSAYLQDAEIYIDGFYSMTPQELQVVNGLMKHCRKVTIALTMDRPFRQGPPDEFYLFAMSARLYDQLYQHARQLDVEIEEDLVFSQIRRFKQSPSLAHLEYYYNKRPAHSFEGKSDITLSMAVNRRAEIEGVARDIISQVRGGHCRWRDIAILVRNGHDYSDLITTVFSDYRIPVFIDSKETMLHHPLIELIRSSLETINTHWRYEPVFRAIKTDMLYPLESDLKDMRLRVDQLENYVLSRGVKGNRWTDKERWRYRRFRGLELEQKGQTDQERAIEQSLNELKELFAAPLALLEKRCKKAKTGQDYAQALYLFLEESKIPEKLEALELAAEEKGDLLSARRHDQAWKSVIELLDQFVETLGSTSLSLKQFITILDAGLQALEFSQVPPAIDQVMVANMDLSRLTDVHIAFVIGLNEGVLPMKVSEEGILSDKDRQSLSSLGIELAPDSTRRLLDEEFTAYRAFTTPSKKLFLSYPLGDEEGGSLLPSPYVQRIKDVIPSLKEQSYQNEPSGESEEQQLAYMPNENVALSYLSAVLQQKTRGYKVENVWYSLYNQLIQSDIYSEAAKKVLGSLFYENIAQPLSEETSKQLYGKRMKASVSRMEKYNACAFSHFASHGLKLQERKVFRLEAPDIGEMFHGALKIISDALLEKKRSWASLTKEECKKYANGAVEQLAPKLQNQILLSTNRHFYIKRKLENVISRASMVLSEQARHSGFEPIKLELDFGFGSTGSLPPLTFRLANGTEMELIGRIDRVDKAQIDQQTYLRIIDYKSSSKDINLDEVYYGLALQMLTYIDVIILHAQKLIGTSAHPAGMLYFHMHNPIIKANEMLSGDVIEEEIFKQFKMKGLLLGDQDVLNMMDHDLVKGEKSSSNVISMSYLKDGSFAKNAPVASEQDMNRLRGHIHHVYEQAGNEIMDGNTIINPYKLKDRIPCTFCPYKSVCMFDNALKENQYRILPPKKPEEVMQCIKDEEDKHE